MLSLEWSPGGRGMGQRSWHRGTAAQPHICSQPGPELCPALWDEPFPKPCPSLTQRLCPAASEDRLRRGGGLRQRRDLPEAPAQAALPPARTRHLRLHRGPVAQAGHAAKGQGEEPLAQVPRWGHGTGAPDPGRASPLPPLYTCRAAEWGSLGTGAEPPGWG